ncbi:MAG: hypothetical protein H7256_09645 [Bdellovibrio sp.]|nr:hypothetical protein [Bdellovibrio sp.]
MQVVPDSYRMLSQSLWKLVHGNPDQLRNLNFNGPTSLLPSKFDVLTAG